MHPQNVPELAGKPTRDWMQVLNEYRQPNALRGVIELVITAGPLIALWLLAWMALSISVWLTLLIAIPAAGFLVRLFMIQHDCGHGAFFRRRTTNDWVGRVLGILTLTPYDVWRRSHAVHHATTGNLDLRGIGDIKTLTVEEYKARGILGRLQYRIYRHPLVLFGIGPGFLFIFQNRLPFGYMRSGWIYWVSTMATNLGIAAFIIAMMAIVEIKPFLLVHLPIVLIASMIGVWLFYIQHQFEDTHWDKDPTWNVQSAAVEGSSHYDLPPVLRWMTANIGVHHIHHLCSRIPYYRLSEVLRDHPELGDVNRVTLWESFKYTGLQLWDPKQNKLISFGDL